MVNFDNRLADHIRHLRIARGYSLQRVADESGVSRATLSRIENSEVSPTAETLGRLATAYRLPISQLLAPLEERYDSLVRRETQSSWSDPANGFTRRAVSPPSKYLSAELVECTIEPRHIIRYEQPSLPGQEHHLLMLSGSLYLTVDGEDYEIGQGDCVRYRLSGPSSFETREDKARYILALA